MSGAAGAVARVFQSSLGEHLFVVDRSRVYDLPPHVAARLRGLLLEDDPSIAEAQIAGLTGVTAARPMQPPTFEAPPLKSLSLNLAQTCNMACGYCYADRGRFGGRPVAMSLDVARASVDRLLAESDPSDDLVIGFIGGEPLLNRRVLRDVTEYASEAARAARRRIRFSLTTNATLIEPADAEWLSRHRFHVSISLDGTAATNDRLRPMLNGGGSYAKVLAALRVFEQHGRPRHLAARVTVTPRSGDLLDILEHHLKLGFDSVGFSAVVVSPIAELAFDKDDFDRFTQQMIRCGRKALAELAAGHPFAFSNFETALLEIHRGSHRPFPCGAAAGYLSVGASGTLYACHRVVDADGWAMGDVHSGSDRQARAAHLQQHHVDSQEPCKRCWARYLCGGGCYHEVAARGRLACDYIRAWLEFCLASYVELSQACPEYFQHSLGERSAPDLAQAAANV